MKLNFSVEDVVLFFTANNPFKSVFVDLKIDPHILQINQYIPSLITILLR